LIFPARRAANGALPTRTVTTVEFATIAYLKIQRMTLILAR
jgi:hypothetical protein